MRKQIKIVVALLFVVMLSGCGAAQSVSEGSASVAKALFVWDVRTLHLDYTARAELNADDNQRSSPVVIRMYQLKDAKSFESASYSSLVDNDQEVLADTLLATKEVVLRPNTSLSVDTPFDKDAEYVGIIALFKEPDLKQNSWRILLKRGDLNINKPREIMANKFALELLAKD